MTPSEKKHGGAPRWFLYIALLQGSTPKHSVRLLLSRALRYARIAGISLAAVVVLVAFLLAPWLPRPAGPVRETPPAPEKPFEAAKAASQEAPAKVESPRPLPAPAEDVLARLLRRQENEITDLKAQLRDCKAKMAVPAREELVPQPRPGPPPPVPFVPPKPESRQEQPKQPATLPLRKVEFAVTLQNIPVQGELTPLLGIEQTVDLRVAGQNLSFHLQKGEQISASEVLELQDGDYPFQITASFRSQWWNRGNPYLVFADGRGQGTLSVRQGQERFVIVHGAYDGRSRSVPMRLEVKR